MFFPISRGKIEASLKYPLSTCLEYVSSRVIKFRSNSVSFCNHSRLNLIGRAGRSIFGAKAFFIERAEREASKPQLDVEIYKVHEVPKFGFPKDREITDGKEQGLMITVKNSSITNLTAQFWLNGQGPNYLEWKVPTETYTPPEITLNPGTGKHDVNEGKLTVKLYNDKINLTKDDTTVLVVWSAWKSTIAKEILTFNTTARIGVQYEGVPAKAKLLLKIKFLCDQEIKGKLEYYYLMSIDSWESLGLTEFDTRAQVELMKDILRDLTFQPNPEYKPEYKNKP